MPKKKIESDLSFPELLNILNLKIVKVQSQTLRKYILYKEDHIKNYILITKTTKNDIVEDLLHYFNNYQASWYISMGFRSRKEAERELKDYLTYQVKRVNDIINDPAKPLFFIKDNISFFNLFQSTKLLMDKPNVSYSWDTIQKVLFNLCENNEDYYNWVINWLAVLYQYPTYRFTTSIIFIGEKGSGKGMFAKVMRKIFDNCCYSANSKDLVSSFNAQLFENKLLLIANEILDQHNKYQFSNDLKEIITEEEISVERKYTDRYIAKNYIKCIFFSNSLQPISIEEGDRRYAVFKSKKLKMPFSEMNNFWEDENFFEKQVLGFCTYLENLLIEIDKVVSEPIMTPAKRDIINVNMTDLRSDILEIIDNLNMYWVQSRDSKWYIKFSEVYETYNKERPNFKKNIARNKWSSKLKINGFITINKTINKETDTYIEVPISLVKKYKATDDLYYKEKIINLEELKRNKEYTIDDLKEIYKSISKDTLLEKIKIAKKQGIIYEPINGVYRLY